MKRIPTLLMLGSITLGGFALPACDNDGPAEKAGEKVDEAVEDMKDTAEETANKVQDKADDVKDKMD